MHWVDGEWSPSLKLALKRLWAMYHDSNNLRIDEKIENGKLVKELCDEKKKLQNKYNSLLEDVHKWMDDTERQVQAENYQKIMHGKSEMKPKSEDAKFKLMEILKKEFERDLGEMEVQRNKLQEELVFLKNKYAADAELIEFREQKCREEREALKLEREAVKVESEALKKNGDDMKKEMDGLKQEKKKLEYMIYDLLKVGEAKKEKFRKIRAMCDEEL
jgi:hypothetical protein